MTYSCIIIDDEPIAHTVLEEHISSIRSLGLKGKFYNCEDAKDFLTNNDIDILFLDIQMPGISGFEFLKQLVNKPITIITTAFREFALEGFELGVMDYLVKPIKLQRFQFAINRAIEFLELKKRGDDLLNDPAQKDQQITIKSGTRLVKLSLQSISHIQGLKDYAIIHTSSGKFVIKGYIKTMEKVFSKKSFIRVHKSFIVAKDRINVLNRGKIEFNDYQIPVGRAYKEEVEKLLNI